MCIFKGSYSIFARFHSDDWVTVLLQVPYTYDYLTNTTNELILFDSNKINSCWEVRKNSSQSVLSFCHSRRAPIELRFPKRTSHILSQKLSSEIKTKLLLRFFEI